MKLSCEQWCPIQEMLANLKCPNCFSAKVKLCEEENKEKSRDLTTAPSPAVKSQEQE
jgi:hypothetical protein